MDRFVKCSLVFGALSIAFGGCGGDEHITMPISTGAGTGAPISGTGAATTAGTGASTGVAGRAGAAGSTTTSTPPSAGTGGRMSAPTATAGTGAATAGTGGMMMVTAGTGASAGTSGSAGSAGAVAGTGGAAGMPGMGGMGSGQTMGTGAELLKPTTNYAEKGQFKTTTNANVGPGNNFTIFRPEPLGEVQGFLHPIIIFGPGILTTASLYNTLLTHLASHGFVTICVNSLSGGPNAPANLDTMKQGLEWLIAQNTTAGTYMGKLAVDRATTMGYSIGATASTQLSSHKAIISTVSIHGHNTKGDPHGPVWLLTGTMDVIDDNRATLKTLEEAPAMMTALPIGHLDVLTELGASGRYNAPITAWLRYWVLGDMAASSVIIGPNCKVCTSPWITPETNEKWKALK